LEKEGDILIPGENVVENSSPQSVSQIRQVEAPRRPRQENGSLGNTVFSEAFDDTLCTKKSHSAYKSLWFSSHAAFAAKLPVQGGTMRKAR
jgi:hypothetical protein